jgi:hypothetical protein
VNNRKVPVNGKKWVTLYFTWMSEPVNMEHVDSLDWLYLSLFSNSLETCPTWATLSEGRLPSAQQN